MKQTLSFVNGNGIFFSSHSLATEAPGRSIQEKHHGDVHRVGQQRPDKNNFNLGNDNARTLLALRFGVNY